MMCFMKRVFFIIGLVLMGISSVLGQKKKEILTPVVVNYTLPKVMYDVVVTMECTDLIPGPLVQYAEAQLGVRPEIEREGQSWKIKTIQFIPKSIPDEKAMFSVISKSEYRGIALSVTPEGFLKGVGLGIAGCNPGTDENLIYRENDGVADDNIDYLSFGLRSTKKEVLDSNFTMVEYEGEMRRQWDPIIRYTLKENADYAEECAREIFDIRQRKMDAIATVDRAALKELERLEENYLSMFLGKRVCREVVKRFSFIPQKEKEAILLFRFSEREGITTKNNVSAQPYVVEVENVSVLSRTEVEGKNSVTGGGAITYRVPASADLVLMKGDSEVMRMPSILPQLGYFMQFPLDVINNEGLSLEFYSAYGSLKSISCK